MNKQSLDERIKHLCENYVDNEVDFSGYVKEIKAIIKDVITEVTPEKVEILETDSNRVFARKEEWNYAIDQVHSKAKELGL